MTTQSAERAMSAWQQGRRRRAAAALVDRMTDGALAAGGIVMANAALPLGLGLPAGNVGLSIGAGLLAAGFAAMTRARRPKPQPLNIMRAPRVVARAAEGHRAA